MRPKSKILIIAGSDSSGGAGIQADIKTITSLGSYAMTAITAITVQNTKGVKSVISIPADIIKDQIIYSAQDIRPDAIKIGMLHTVDVVKKVMLSLERYSHIQIPPFYIIEVLHFLLKDQSKLMVQLQFMIWHFRLWLLLMIL